MKKAFCLILSLFFIVTVYAEKVRVLKNTDGSIAIVHLAKKPVISLLTDKEWETYAFAKATSEGIEFEDIDKKEIPEDRTYRNAWKLDGDKIKVNQTKKQEIIDKKNVKKNAKISGRNKLKALGLSKAEINAMIGE